MEILGLCTFNIRSKTNDLAVYPYIFLTCNTPARIVSDAEHLLLIYHTPPLSIKGTGTWH
jgi:hypothetical protein